MIDNNLLLQKQQEIEQLKAALAEKLLAKWLLECQSCEKLIEEINQLNPPISEKSVIVIKKERKERAKKEQNDKSLMEYIELILKEYSEGISANEIMDYVIKLGYKTNMAVKNLKTAIYINLSRGKFPRKLKDDDGRIKIYFPKKEEVTVKEAA